MRPSWLFRKSAYSSGRSRGRLVRHMMREEHIDIFRTRQSPLDQWASGCRNWADPLAKVHADSSRSHALNTFVS